MALFWKDVLKICQNLKELKDRLSYEMLYEMREKLYQKVLLFVIVLIYKNKCGYILIYIWRLFTHVYFQNKVKRLKIN